MLDFYEAFQKCEVPKALENELYDANESIKIINGLNKVNVFIGANNSGKSRILREVLRLNRTTFYSDSNAQRIIEIVNGFFQEVEDLHTIVGAECNKLRYRNQTTIFDFSNVKELRRTSINVVPGLKIRGMVDRIGSLIRPLTVDINETIYASNKDYFHDSQIHEPERSKILNKLSDLYHKFEKLQGDMLQLEFPDIQSPSNIYIPGIRTLRPFAKKADVERSTQDEYKFSKDIIVFNGQSLANEVQRLRNAPYPENLRLEKFETFLSNEFFESKKIRLNVPINSDLMTIKIGDEKEQPIYNLGDGLQMVIILTFPFFAYNKGFVVIEEPELFIHPGLQKALLQFFCNHPSTKNFQIFITTHSNHIIDSINNSNKISLFTVAKKAKSVNDREDEKLPDFILENVAYGNQNLLNLLGITNTSVYLSNCTIWVEGITDRIYIQKFITEYLKQTTLKEKYKNCKEYQEGIHYSFALTGGDSIIHWDFEDDSEYESHKNNIIVRKFCGKSMLIVDNDFGKNSKRKRNLKDLLQNRFVELKVPEIENLLAPATIKNALLEYDSISRQMSFDKFPELDSSTMKEHKIGYIIDKILMKNRPEVKKFSKTPAPDGRATIKPTDKLAFCEKAVLHISFETMSKDSIKLVEQILDFIVQHNPSKAY